MSAIRADCDLSGAVGAVSEQVSAREHYRTFAGAAGFTVSVGSTAKRH